MSKTLNLRNRRAFTLIELMVVILILAILAALIVPKVLGRADTAKVAKAKSDIATISNTLDTYRLDNGSYPTTEEGLMALVEQPSGATNWKGPYLKAQLDPWGHEYQYEFSGGSGDNAYTITCLGADGAPGGDGLNADIIEGGQ